MTDVFLFISVLFIDSFFTFVFFFSQIVHFFLLITSPSRFNKSHKSPFPLRRKRVYENGRVISLLCNAS